MCVSGESCGLCWANYRRSSTDPTKCEKLNTCDVNDCEGQSECEAHTSDKYVCRCPAGRSGLSCEHRDHSAQTSATSGNVVTTVVVVVILLVLLLVVLGCVYWYKRRPFTFWKSRGSRARDRVYHFVNPAFGVMHDQPIIESDDSPESTMSAQRTYRRPPPSAPSSPSTTLMKDQEQQQQQLDYQKHKEDSQVC
ncbi:hypothetical protein GWK47_015373 [Chionoecetes opilio]|uniref:EGF-like domain-containing protein n=1 Tax=Chionoecetes opilio TaxID=41210 RepID=A0A8J5CKM7_CHIOP|nr:hypothetical protein GWK47_015373 [Chionoecetes opilio]